MRRGVVLLVLAAGLSLGACGSSEEAAEENLVPVPAPATPTTPPDMVGAASTAAGEVLVDARGHVLYVHAKDTAATAKAKAVSACAGACAEEWPPYLSKSGMPVGLPGIDPRALGILVRADGGKQITYAGRPLYRYSGDTGPNQTSGAGKDSDWSVASAG